MGLLWIKGGAGKGKTMMSIGLIEELESLSRQATETSAVTYFFCQNADYELNTIESIIKGLILQLVRQEPQLTQWLRNRWDMVNKQFTEDIHSWRNLWTIFTEMLHHYRGARLYIVVDALDECQDGGMAELLKLIVRRGLDWPSRIKWLVTSRPLDSAERVLLAGPDQVRVSLELNPAHISYGVRTYISHKATELDRWCEYGTDLRLLKVMMLTYRPLDVRELSGLSGVSDVNGLLDDRLYVEKLADRCASFVTIRQNKIHFVHQSARDYLGGQAGGAMLDRYDQYGHGAIALNCLTYLSEQLKVDLLDLQRPDSTREMIKGREAGLLVGPQLRRHILGRAHQPGSKGGQRGSCFWRQRTTYGIPPHSVPGVVRVSQLARRATTSN